MFAVMNVSPVVRLLKFGRGRYGEALAMIAERTVTPFVTVGSDHDWRNGVVLEDQATRLGLRDRVIYLPASRWSGDQPEWLIIHDFAEQPVAEPIVVTPPGRAYRLVAIFPYGGLSGWSWIVYRSAAARGP
jgi:hypothetical protein